MKYTKLPFLLFLFILFTVNACSQTPTQKPVNKYSPNTNIEYGKASFYADKYQGRQTANGERFRQSARTAAHKTLTFGTWVKVTNRSNGRSVIVRINDRGPFIKGRIIDLSKSSFSVIANRRLGVVDVRVEVLR